jgi:hypothetical protein
MLNLTADRVTLLVPDNAHEDLTHTCEPSGFIAWVEHERRLVGNHGFPYRKQIEAGTANVPIFEDVPRAIFTTTTDDTRVPFGRHAFEEHGLLLVTREVAEAAAALSHPSASRMVWVDRPKRDLNMSIVGYRVLQRSANVRDSGITR